MVKKIVDALDGQVVLTSNPKIEKGTTITISLNQYQPIDIFREIKPYAVAKNTTSIVADPHIISKAFNADKRSMLIVEDTKAMLSYLHQKFSEKYNVEYALNGAEALKKLQALIVRPDLIVTDIMMDVMDGFNFIKIIQELNEFKHIPVIFLSAKTTQMDRLKALKMGAIDFIQKPFSYQELACKIESILKNIVTQQKETHRTILSNLNGGSYVKNAQSFERLAKEKLNRNQKLFNLTAKEVEICSLVQEGFKYGAIAENLFIPESTVKNTSKIYPRKRM